MEAPLTLLDPVERAQRGAAVGCGLGGSALSEPATLVEASIRDFVLSEVWSRPALDHRSRFWIAMTAAACNPRVRDDLDQNVRKSLILNLINLAELREAALHAAVYGGWPSGVYWDQAITRVAIALDLPPVMVEPIQPRPRLQAERRQSGIDSFHDIMTFPIAAQGTPYFEVGNLGFVFPEMWSRPGLDLRARRLISLVASAESASSVALSPHIYAALQRKELTLEEVNEFALQYAVECGWSKGALVQAAILIESRKVAENIPYS